MGDVDHVPHGEGSAWLQAGRDVRVTVYLRWPATLLPPAKGRMVAQRHLVSRCGHR